MNETAIVYALVIGIIFSLFAGMRWLAPYLDRWGERIDAEEEERRRPKGPRPPLPPSQYPRITPEQRAQFEQSFNESMMRIKIMPYKTTFMWMPVTRIEPDIEDEP